MATAGTENYVFFDRQEVIDAVDEATRRELSRFGAYVRRAARQTIRKRKKASKPGSPPSSHTGRLKRGIFFAFDRTNKSVVVGPIKNRSGAQPPTLEYGGTSRKTVPALTFSVGKPGVVRMTPDGRPIWRRLDTEAQVKRSERLYEEYRARVNGRTFRIAARPYMRPALLANLRVAPQMFHNSLVGVR